MNRAEKILKEKCVDTFIWHEPEAKSCIIDGNLNEVFDAMREIAWEAWKGALGTISGHIGESYWKGLKIELSPKGEEEERKLFDEWYDKELHSVQSH